MEVGLVVVIVVMAVEVVMVAVVVTSVIRVTESKVRKRSGQICLLLELHQR